MENVLSSNRPTKKAKYNSMTNETSNMGLKSIKTFRYYFAAANAFLPTGPISLSFNGILPATPPFLPGNSYGTALVRLGMGMGMGNIDKEMEGIMG